MMEIGAGSRLGPYELLSPLGAGGMGEVWKARDTRLERAVAIKVLSPKLSASPESRQRFEREARTISQLSHPHICALYDVGREGETEYLVMELLEGQTLSERLVKGALPLDQTLRFGMEIADALDKAHRQGIVHRDLKPGNVMLTKSGVKLLDFGLAKAFEPPAARGSLTELPTKAALTQEGTILGTFQYMAPEQLEGKEADARTDIFALGAVLYEMATGKKAFSAATPASLITAIMSSDPEPIATVQPMTPPALERVVKTCIAKDPEDRWQSAHDVASQLKWITGDTAAGGRAPAGGAPGRRRSERIAWMIAGLAVLGLAMLASRGPRPRPAGELIRFAISFPSGRVLTDAYPSLSPDGRRVAVLLQDPGGRTSIRIRSLDGLSLRELPGTDDSRFPFWSPDGHEIAFFSEGKLKRMSAEGGPAQTICQSGSGFGGAWSNQGTVLFTSEFGSGIVAVPASGGVPRAITTLDRTRGDTTHFYPSWLPDERHFVFVARNLDPEKTAVMVGSVDSKEVRSLFHSNSAAVYTDPGYLLFARDGALIAQGFDAQALRLIGEPTPVFENVRYGTEDNRLDVSAGGGSLAYALWSLQRQLVWVDRSGRELGPLGAVGAYEDVRISPDGQRVMAAVRDATHGQNLDLWVLDSARGRSSRITSESTDEFGPAWFPDGERVAYVSDQGGYYDLYERSIGGAGATPLFRDAHDKLWPTLSSDGQRLLFGLADGANYARMLLPLDAQRRIRRLSQSARFSEVHPEISPDGRWSAFESDESGQREVYLEPLPSGPKRQISVGGGQTPIWRKDGAELFYCSRDGMLIAVATGTRGDHVNAGEPVPLFPLRSASFEINSFRRPYDVAPDGKRFLIVRLAPEAEPSEMVVALNWTAALKKGK